MKLVIVLLSALLGYDKIYADSDKTSSEIKKVVTDSKEAKEGQFPFQVHFNGCGGTLIDSLHVLTAAHCIKHLDIIKDKEVLLDFVDVELGMTQLNSSRKITIRSKKIFIHESYGKDFSNDDIAIVLLKRPVELSETVKPAKLTYQIPKPNTIALVSGWGKTITRNDPTPNDLMFAEAQVMSNVDCQKFHEWASKKYGSKNRTIDDGQICAKSVGESGVACTGDSGGPLSVEGEVIGIVSLSEIPCDKKYPVIYTRVSYYKDWIQKILKMQ